MNKNFWNGKKIILTGASSGIGKAIAESLLDVNCSLHLISRRVSLIEEFIDSAANTRANVSIHKCDVSDKMAVREICEKIYEIDGAVDIAILNSGVSKRKKLTAYDPKIAEDVFGVNLFGVIYFTEWLLPKFIEKKNGIIAGVSSLADNRGYPGSGFYSASKAALSIYLESLRIESALFGVKVITVKPGFVRTPMTSKNNFSMPFLMAPERAAEYIINGIEKGKPVIQFPWQTVFLSKLIGNIPAIVYEFLSSRRKY